MLRWSVGVALIATLDPDATAVEGAQIAGQLEHASYVEISIYRPVDPGSSTRNTQKGSDRGGEHST